MKVVYIAHPLMGDESEEWGDPEKNVERYLRIAAWATNMDDVVVLTWVHHWFMQLRGLTPAEDCFDFYLERDEALILKCDELWVAGPPEVSFGTRREIAFAEANNIKVVILPGHDKPEATGGEIILPRVKL